jgi:hypothetical protein
MREPKHAIFVADRGNVEFEAPAGWKIEGGKGGSVVFTDPTAQASVEMSYVRFGALSVVPPVDQFLAQVMDREHDHPTRERSPVQSEWRGPMQLARAWRTWAEADKDRGNAVREARGWTLIGANKIFQVLVTCSYWKDDEPWVGPIWDRVVASLHLGDGNPYQSPAEHWAMKPRS